jgi:predicted metalloprotease with PDZ domain
MQPPTRYRVVVRDPHAHLFEVSCTIVDPDPAGQGLRLPTWIPGSYLIREFARQFVRVRAEANGAAVPIVKEAKDLWRAAPCAGPLCVIADVYAFDFSVRTAYLDAFAATSTVPRCSCARGTRRRAMRSRARRARGSRRIETGELRRRCRRRRRRTWSFGTYRADDYDALIDHPVEMADFVSASFEAGGARHDVAITGKVHVDLDRLSTDLARICQWQADLFGGARQSRAVRPLSVPGRGGRRRLRRPRASVEHEPLLQARRLPAPGAPASRRLSAIPRPREPRVFPRVERQADQAGGLRPYDLARESYTRQLWAFEGITSYYDDLALVRSGVIDPKSYLELVGQNITTVLRGPGRRCRASATRASTPGSSSTAATRTRRTRSSAITSRARSSRLRSTSRCARRTSLDD